MSRLSTAQTIRLWTISWGIAMLAGCGGGDDASVPLNNIRSDAQPATAAGAESSVAGAVEPVKLTASEHGDRSPARPQTDVPPEVRIQTSLGSMLVRLNPERAPRTVENFLYNYVERGFYDGTIVHFVEPGYMIAAGGYEASYEPKETRTPILCEADNGLKNLRGTIAMARHPDFPNSATSQFFINLADSPALDYKLTDEHEMNGYCVFGEVVDGFDVAEKIAAVRVQDRDEFINTPADPVIIESITRVK
jgi:cyclophilin family peptidyl-prolyl cis-trans isomerase